MVPSWSLPMRVPVEKASCKGMFRSTVAGHKEAAMRPVEGSNDVRTATGGGLRACLLETLAMLPGRGGKSRPSILSAWGPDGYLAQATTYALSNSGPVTDPRGLRGTTHLTPRRTKRWRSCPSNKGRICGSLVEEHATATCRTPQQQQQKRLQRAELRPP